MWKPTISLRGRSRTHGKSPVAAAGAGPPTARRAAALVAPRAIEATKSRLLIPAFMMTPSCFREMASVHALQRKSLTESQRKRSRLDASRLLVPGTVHQRAHRVGDHG